MSRKSLLVCIWIVGSGVLYYVLTEPMSSSRIEVFVDAVIDGDTIVLNDSSRVRLLGINTPEKNMPHYDAAKVFLSNAINQSVVQLEVGGSDRYKRTLGHIFDGSIHINRQLILEGFATLYYYGSDEHYSSLENAESTARSAGKGLWKPSPKSGCVSLVELTYKEHPKRCTNNERLVLKNSCDYSIDVVFKDDATHIFRETLSANRLFSKNFSCIFNDAGDSLYVWDDVGLVLFHRYT